MTDSGREQLLQALTELGTLFPDWRFGQLVANVATAARGPHVEAIWDSEDEELLAAARRLIERNGERAEAQTGRTAVPGRQRGEPPERYEVEGA